jgi:uncharacterized protein
MPIIQQGSVNTTALVVPDLYVQIVPPQNLILNGVPTDIIGMVGTASWGPTNQPVIVGSMAEYATSFGPVIARTGDMGTQLATAVQQGAQNFRCVRVTDGTDTAAVSNLGTGAQLAISFISRNSGSFGNQFSATLLTGSQAGSFKLIFAAPGLQPEVFDNISGTGSAFWQALANAVNTGTGPLRGPSLYFAAVAMPGAIFAPSSGLTTQAGGGTDGAAGVTSMLIVGQDTLPRTGMYALRGQTCSIALLADLSDPTTWTTQAEFGLEEGIYMILTGPAGDTITNAVTTMQGSGLDSYSAKLMFGDWLWWNDTTNGTTRLVSPQGFVAGRLANLSPEQSSLNKQLYGVVGSQRSGTPGSGQANSYSAAELSALLTVGIDVITNPQPGGNFWGVRGGHNTSSSAATDGDDYTRLTNYIAATLSAGMGVFVGQVIQVGLFQKVRATLLSFLQGMLGQGLLGSTDGSLPFSVVCDTSNNPPARTGLGYLQADVQVQYQAINEKFIVNVEGGQTVSIQRQTLPSGQIG